jgi:hypothetical protein
MRVWTNFDGAILEVTPAAAELLNVAARGLTRRPFYQFFRDDRHKALRALDLAARGESDAFSAQLQPREKKVVQVRVVLEPAPPDAVLWTLTPM